MVAAAAPTSALALPPEGAQAEARWSCAAAYRPPVQEMRIPDSVLRISRHKGHGIETEHPAVFPIALPEFLIQAYTDEGEAVFEPFAGSGTTILAGQRTGRRVRAIEFAPAYVDLAIARWRLLHPDLPVTLAEDGRDYDAVAAARVEAIADAA